MAISTNHMPNTSVNHFGNTTLKLREWMNVDLRRVFYILQLLVYRDRNKSDVAKMPYSDQITPRILYHAKYHRQHWPLQSLIHDLEHCLYTTTINKQI